MHWYLNQLIKTVEKKDVENFQLSFILNNFKPSPPIALSSGQYSFEYLTELFGVYDNILNFDNMKIPFRCNATNILTGEEIIFKFCSDEFSRNEIKNLINHSYKNFRAKDVVMIRKLKKVNLIGKNYKIN